MSPCNRLLLLLTFWTSLQDGLGVPLAKRPGETARDVVSHRRTKRCACSSRLDNECHYFCHLDIIWINTPSKTTLYGLGNPVARPRRAASSAARCSCASSADSTCASFCVYSFKVQTVESATKRPQPTLLSVLRGLADASHKTKTAVNPQTENAFDASETNVG